MDLYVYSDESGVFDKVHNSTFVFGGLLFLSKEEKDYAVRRYKAVEKKIRKSESYGNIELKAAQISPTHKRKLFNSTDKFYRFGAVIEQARVLDSIMSNKKSKQRYLDYVFKISLKRLLQRLILENIINPDDVENIHILVDEHTTATDGKYELRETIEEEFKFGIYNYNYSGFLYPAIFPHMKCVNLDYCNSKTVTLIRAADIIANRLYWNTINKLETDPFDKDNQKFFISYFP